MSHPLNMAATGKFGDLPRQPLRSLHLLLERKQAWKLHTVSLAAENSVGSQQEGLRERLEALQSPQNILALQLTLGSSSQYNAEDLNLLSSLANLQHLRVECPYALSSEDFHFLSKMERLLSLEIIDAPTFNATSAGYLSSMKKLSHLSLRFCPQISSLAVPAICGLTNLISLEIIGSKLKDTSILPLYRLRHLIALNLSCTDGITKSGATVLARKFALIHLALSDCPAIEEEGFARVAALQTLRSLDLSSNASVGRSVVKVLAEHGLNLEHLSLEGCSKLNESDVESLFGLPNLRRLNIRGLQRKMVADVNTGELAAAGGSLEIISDWEA